MSSLPCRDCAAGALHGGTPTGTVTTLHGLPTYVAEPPSGEEAKGVIVILPDAFGWELVNNRIMADNYASKGKYRTLLPDFMNGHWVAPDLLYTMDNVLEGNTGLLWRGASAVRAFAHLMPFLFFNRASVTGPRIHSFMRDLRASTTLPVGAAGFCWGGKWVTALSSGEPRTADGDRPLIDAGFTAHPSGLELPKDAEAITLPYCCAYPSEDMGLPKDKWALLKSELDKRDNCEYQVYEGAKHGFAVRGNPDNEVEKKQGEEAEEQALQFFDKWLARNT